MKITFGKFKDRTVDSLKHTADGVNYLEWGAQYLREAKWRQAFAAALATMTDHDHAMIMVREDHIDYGEALTHARQLFEKHMAELDKCSLHEFAKTNE